jgi:ribosomal-protein-alanine N-acetyltransferase
MDPSLTLETERLLLKQVSIEESDFMFRLMNSAGWIKFIGDRKIGSVQDAASYIERIQKMPDFFYWVISTKKQGVPVGIISFLKRSYLDHFDLGFAFLPEAQGNGFAYEAASAVINAAFADPNHASILATTVPDNFKSIGLLEKLGFLFREQIMNEGKSLSIFVLKRNN